MPFNTTHKLFFYFVESCIFAFIFAAVFLPYYIKWLKRFQIRQFIREDGPASHATKDKTPTTGGIAFALATFIGLILFSALNSNWDILSLAVASLALLCACLGASDDLTKITKQNNRGLSARFRLLTELALGLIFGLIILKAAPQQTSLILTAHNFIVLPPLVFLLLSVFLVTATTNAVNLHDGMDGLAAGTTMLILFSLAIMLWQLGNTNLSLLAFTSAGALGGFLIFNRHPAKIFMGDTGSLFLGGLLAGLILASGLLIWFIPLSIIYILETLSVMVQVSYFKLTKPVQGSAIFKLTHKLPGEGKRLFRMAPLHHHFEAVLADKGIAEHQVVLGFWLVQLSICLLVLAVFFAF